MEEEVFQEEQQVETPQEPRLSDENRAKLNSIIAKMKDNNESEDDIRAMVGQFKAKYLPKPSQTKTEQPKVSKQSEQAFESRQQPWLTPQGEQPKQEQPKQTKPAKKQADKPIELISFNKRVSSEQTVLAPIQQEAEFEITIRDQKKVELAKKAEEANKRLTQELASEGIPAVKKFLEKQRKDAAFQAADNVVRSYGDMGYMQSHQNNMRNAIAKENLQLMPQVNEMTANAAMQQLSQTPEGQRTILKAYVDANPTKAKEVEANQYAVDANNRENDPVKVMSNIDRIKSGELVYDVQNGILKKPVSFVEGWSEAMKEGEKEIKGYEKFSQMSNKEAVAALDQLLARDADDYVVEVNGLGGWVGQTLGSFTNEAALALGTSAATLPISGPYSVLIGAASTSKMVRERSWFQNYVRVYAELVEEGRVTKEVAEKRAREAADESSMIDTFVNVATEAVGLGILGKGFKAMSKGTKKLIGKEMIDNVEEVAKKTGMSTKEQIAIISAISGAGEGAKNIIAQEAGVRDREITEGVTEAMAANLLLAGGINIIAKTFKAAPSKLKQNREILQSISKQDEQVVVNQVNDLANAGLITPEEGQYVLDQIQAQKVRDEKLPPGISKDDGVRVKAQDIVEQIEQLEAKKESVPKSLHGEINQKIEELTIKMKGLKPEEDIEVEVKSPEVKVKETVIPEKIEKHEDADLILDEIFKSETSGFKGDAVLDSADKVIEEGMPSREGIVKAERWIAKGEALMNELFPDWKMEVYNSSKDFAKEGRGESSAGVYVPTQKKVALNLELIRKRADAENTGAHEATHIMVGEALQSSPDGVAKAYAKLEKIFDLPGMEEVRKHMAQYDTVYKQKVEGLTEFFTRVVEGKIDISGLSNDFVTKIIDVVNSILEAMGSSKRFSTAGDIKRLAESIKSAFEGDTSLYKKTIGERKKLTEEGWVSMDALKQDNPNLYNKVKEVITKSVNSTDEQLVTSLKRHLPEDEARALVEEVRGKKEGASSVSVIKPEDVKKPEVTTVSAKEVESVKTKGAKVILPESNKKPNIVETIKTVTDERKEKGEEVLSGTPETQQAGVEKDSASATNITHAEVERRRAEMGLDEYVKEKKSMSDLDAEVDAMIAKNPNALNDLLSDLESGNKTSTSPTEQLLMNRRAQELVALIEKDPGNKALEKLYDRLTNVTNVQRSETGRALGMFTNTDPTSSYAEMRNYAKESRGVDRLTEAEEAELKQQYEAIKKDRDEFEAKVAELEAARLKDEAEKAILTEKLKMAQEAKKAQKAQKKADTKKEKEQTIEDMKKAIRDAGKQMYAVPLPYLPQVIAAAPYVAKYAKILVKEGIDQLEDIVANIKTTLQEDIPDIQDRDIIDILGGRYDKKKETQTDLKARISEIKTEARLVGELEDILSGKEPVKNERAKRAQNKRITELKERIKALTKDKEVRDAVDGEDSDANVASKLKTLKTTYDKKLKEVEERLKNKDFVNKKRIPVLEDKEIKESQPELFKQAEDAAIAYRKKKKDFMVEQMKYELENAPGYSKGAEMVKGVQGLARELQSTADFSAVLRQGLILGVTRPKLVAKALGDMFKSTASKKYFEDWYAKLEDTELWDLAVKKSKLSLADPSDPRLLAREDVFMGGGMAGHVPLLGKVVRGSERAYTMYLNSLRLSAFEVAAKNLMNEGKTFESNPELFKGWARYINAASGRGNIGEFGEKSALAFSTILYSPRLVASRLELLGLTDIVSVPFPSITKGFYRNLPSEIRNRALIDMTTSIAAGSMGLFLAKSMGADVETDPRSTDFGKIKVGETRYDTWAGMQPFVRTFAQIMTNSYVNSKGKEVSLNKGYGQKDAESTYTKFWRNKLAPVPSLAASLIFRKDSQGNKVIFDWDEPGKYEVNAEEMILNTFLPLSNEEWADIFKDPSMQNAMDILVSLFGVGVNQYDREETRKVKPLIEIVTGSKEK